jgi:hypothetical protein
MALSGAHSTLFVPPNALCDTARPGKDVRDGKYNKFLLTSRLPSFLQHLDLLIETSKVFVEIQGCVSGKQNQL